jgi:hypothetical protein
MTHLPNTRLSRKSPSPARAQPEAIQVIACAWIASSFLLAGDGSRLFRQPYVKRNDMVIFRQLLKDGVCPAGSFFPVWAGKSGII